jgi:lactate 2-monooxygenase
MVIESGREVQQQVYGTPDNPWPVGPDEWEQRAREAIDRGAFDYIAGGAAQEWTVRANREAFDRWRLRPAMLRGNDTRDMAVEILGMRCAVPFLIAPIGVQEIAHADGDLAVARAAAATATPMVVSSAASYSMEDIAGELGTAPAWYQLYWVSDREVVASLVHRAQAAGYRGIIVTLDTLTLGWRDRDLRNAYLPFLQGRGVA